MTNQIVQTNRHGLLTKECNQATDILMKIIIQIPSILIIEYDRKGSNFDTTSLYDII